MLVQYALALVLVWGRVERAKSWRLYPALDARCIVLDEALLLALLGHIAEVPVVHSKEHTPKNCERKYARKKDSSKNFVGHISPQCFRSIQSSGQSMRAGLLAFLDYVYRSQFLLHVVTNYQECSCRLANP